MGLQPVSVEHLQEELPRRKREASLHPSLCEDSLVSLRSWSGGVFGEPV
jgi:hypothetical protein